MHIHKVVYSTFDIHPFMTVDKHQPVSTFMGITTEYEDIKNRSLKFGPTSELTQKKTVKQKMWRYDPVNDIIFGVNFNFVETVNENQYTQFWDSVSTLGGFLAMIWAFFWFISPVIVFYFLIRFAMLVREKT